MSYEIYTWDELKKLLPGLEVYDGYRTIAGLQGILDFIEREKAKGKLIDHTFQQVIPFHLEKFLYMFKIKEL